MADPLEMYGTRALTGADDPLARYEAPTLGGDTGPRPATMPSSDLDTPRDLQARRTANPPIGQGDVIPRAFWGIIDSMAESYLALGRWPRSLNEAAQNWLTVMPGVGGLTGMVRRARAAARPPLVLHHNGPPGLPEGRPTGAMHYFGTSDFSDMEGHQFGPHRYIYEMPDDLAGRIVQLADDNPQSRRVIADMVERSFPGEQAGFLRGGTYADELANFYEIFADRDNWGPYFAGRNIDLPGVAYHNEYLLPTGTIQRLRLLRSMRDPNVR